MAKDLLFEIGAEEIPAGFLPNIIKQLGELATAALAERHIPYGAVKVAKMFMKHIKAHLYLLLMMLMEMRQKQPSVLLVVKD